MLSSESIITPRLRASSDHTYSLRERAQVDCPVTSQVDPQFQATETQSYPGSTVADVTSSNPTDQSCNCSIIDRLDVIHSLKLSPG